MSIEAFPGNYVSRHGVIISKLSRKYRDVVYDMIAFSLMQVLKTVCAEKYRGDMTT